MLGSGKSKISTSHVVAVTRVGTFLFSKPHIFLPVKEARLQQQIDLAPSTAFYYSPATFLLQFSPPKKELCPLGCHSLIPMLSAELYSPGVLSPAETERVSRVTSCTEVFYSQRFGQRQKWAPTTSNERISPLGIK